MKLDRMNRAVTQFAGAAVLAVATAVSMPVRAAGAASPRSTAMASASAPTRQVADWVARSGDNRGAGYAILDKVNARLYVFDAAGRLRGDAPVLLGAARGDDSVPGIGERPMADIKPFERTTPAGRFNAEPGRNAQGEDIFWVDYDNAISMHRVRATNPKERRLQRLATPTAADNRISYGCINVPAAFYDRVVGPTFAAGNAVVYVLPETRPAQLVFGWKDEARPLSKGVRKNQGVGGEA